MLIGTLWFNESIIRAINLLISAIAKYGFSLKEDVKTDNVLLQFLYDEDTSKIIENRLIRFTNIDTNLQAQLEENEGLIVFSK